MEENNEKKLNDNLGAVNSLLDTINDKDESVRVAVEKALIRTCKRRPNETIEIIYNFRQKNVKLADAQVSILMRVIESFVREFSDQLSERCLDKVIEICISEMIRANEHTPLIQNPCLETLVAAGRVHCAKVMEGLSKQLNSSQVAHFMVMHCIGSLATANIKGAIPFFRQILETIIPNLGGIKFDHVKQAYSFALGRIAEAISEYISNREDFTDDVTADENYATELTIAYSVLLQQWLPHREPKVCTEILQALSHIYPLLPHEKVLEQAPKVIPLLQSFYRRSMDRNTITQLLASVLKTTIDADCNSLEGQSDSLISNLFDLVCVIPDYEKPQTVKGHYEVLRCFDLLLPIYSAKILDMLLIQLRSNNERERIKALLVVTHITNTSSETVASKIDVFIEILKHMLSHEKTLKVKMVLLRTIVAFAQKALLQDHEFVRFIILHCCQPIKVNLDHGSNDEYVDFMQACKNSLYILASTVGTMDDLLKRELLQFYVLLDYTDICGTIAKCMAKLFEKSCDLSYTIIDPEKPQTHLPSAETVFARSLILLGNTTQSRRSEHILQFLKSYGRVLHKLLHPLWTTEVPLLINSIKEEHFDEKVCKFVVDTIKEYDDPAFPETLVNKLADQLTLYPIALTPKEFFVPALHEERGMLLKLIGTCLCYVTDSTTTSNKIEYIIGAARQEKLEKIQPNAEFDSKMTDACIALGYVSKIHLDMVLQKLEQLIEESGQKKSSGNFFTNFISKDSQKDIELYKVNLLAVEAYERVLENIAVPETLKDINEKIVVYLSKQLNDAKDITMKKKILQTLLTLCEQMLKYNDLFNDFPQRSALLMQLVKIDANYDNLPLYPTILRLSTVLMQIHHTDEFDVQGFFEQTCRTFFLAAQQLKSKFDSVEEDDRNSYIAKYINISLPEINHLLKVIFAESPTPATLDDVHCVLDFWIRDRNSEVRICAAHVMNSALNHFIRSVKIGCEAPSKFNQSGTMIGKIVPRCVDTNAGVRQTSVDILKHILEITCIYETLTIADHNDEWFKDLCAIREDIILPNQLNQMTEEISRIISSRLSNFQYMQFCKTLLYALDDSELSSAIGAAIVLKNFIRLKGGELFHAVPELIKESLRAISECNETKTKVNVLKALVALAKHHPKLVCSEMLGTPLPFQSNAVDFWQFLSLDAQLSGIIIDHFLGILSSSCLYEAPNENGNSGERQNIATHQPFAIFCALKEMFGGKELQNELKHRFPALFAILLTSVAIYTNVAAPHIPIRPTTPPNAKQSSSSKSKFGFVPNKELLKMNPCQIVMDAFTTFLLNVGMEQLAEVLTVVPHLAVSTDLNKFMELLTPMANALVNQLGISSSSLSQTLQAISKYISSPYDHQRIASVGLYAMIVPLKPSGDLSATIMLHLNSALGDPNPLVRGFCIRGMAYVGNLNEHDVDKYSEMSLTALLKGIDDNNANCFINIPLESMRGLSRIVMALHKDKLETFQVSLAIRIRPFFENPSTEIREAAILLFGDLCRVKNYGTDSPQRSTTHNHTDEAATPVSEALREQLFTNFMPMILHLSETDSQIVRSSKVTLRKICRLMNAPKVNEMVQNHLVEHGQLHYDIFILNFLKTVNEELSEHISDFIESCLPFLKSQWPEIRGNAACLIGILHNVHAGSSHQQHSVEYLSHKVSVLLHDDQLPVRVKAANALGFMFGELV